MARDFQMKILFTYDKFTLLKHICRKILLLLIFLFCHIFLSFSAFFKWAHFMYSLSNVMQFANKFELS